MTASEKVKSLVASGEALDAVEAIEMLVDHVKTLPIENLKAIAARPLDRFNYLIVIAAELELQLRKGEG